MSTARLIIALNVDGPTTLNFQNNKWIDLPYEYARHVFESPTSNRDGLL
jgi:hypothetical protein